MEISWALIINHHNHLNLLNLRNYSISQSINRGLGVGTKESILERKVMLVVYLHNLGAVELRVLVLEVGLYSYLIHHLAHKDNSSPNLVLCLSHVYWFNECFQLYC